MGYQVIYDDKKHKNKEKHSFRFIPLTMLAFLLFLLMVNARWPEGQEVLRKYLLPEPVDAALTAVNTFASKLQSGELLPDVWEAFCYEIQN